MRLIQATRTGLLAILNWLMVGLYQLAIRISAEDEDQNSGEEELSPDRPVMVLTRTIDGDNMEIMPFRVAEGLMGADEMLSGTWNQVMDSDVTNASYWAGKHDWRQDA